MLGAIMGDICGSLWEGGQCREEDFRLFPVGAAYSDDTVCTVAVMDALLTGQPIEKVLRAWCRRYPGCGYGAAFNHWVYQSTMGPYQSWGNGGAMRVSACGWLAKSAAEADTRAAQMAGITHDHPLGLKCAQAVAGAIWLFRQGVAPNTAQSWLTARYGLPVGRSFQEWKDIAPGGTDAIDTVPLALDCAMQATSIEDAIRRAVLIGGDTDTTASMAAAVAEARFRLSISEMTTVMQHIPEEMQNMVRAFYAHIEEPMAIERVTPAPVMSPNPNLPWWGRVSRWLQQIK